MVQQGKYIFVLLLADLKLSDEKLFDKLMSNPLETLGVMEDAVKSYVIERGQEFSKYDGKTSWQVCIKSD